MANNQVLNIIHLYPDLLNLYGDRGNIACMQKRLEWRGIDAKVSTCTNSDHSINLENADIIFVGGGSHADMPSTDLSDEDFADGEIGILAMMVKGGLAASNVEARRLVQQGGVSINDEKITDPKFALKKSAFENELILKKGKKVFHKFKY